MAPYSELDVQKALDLCKGGLSLAKASKLAGVPKSTLYGRKNGILSAREAFQKQQKLSADWERALVDYVVEQNQLGLTPTHSQITALAKGYLASDGQETTIGKNWLSRFIKRHPEIATSHKGVTSAADIEGETSSMDIEDAASSRDIEGATSSSRDIEGGILSSDIQQACYTCSNSISLLRTIEKRMSDQTAELVKLRQEIGHLRNEVKALHLSR